MLILLIGLLLSGRSWAFPQPAPQFLLKPLGGGVSGAGAKNEPSIPIRVRIGQDIALVKVRGFDIQIRGIGMRETSRNFLPSAKGQEKKLILNRLSHSQIRCSEGQVLIQVGASADSRHGPIRPVRFNSPISIQSAGGFVSFQGQPYHQELRIYPQRTPQGIQCEVVNILDLEKYLDGLVNSEFSSQWNEEAISAQVVAARTYALYQIELARKVPRQHFDLDSSVRDQAYFGFIREDFRSSRMVTRTRGWVLTSAQDSQTVPIKAFYHSTCGGMTEVPKNVWGDSYPGLGKHVICPYCASSPRLRWELELPHAKLERALLVGIEREKLGGLKWKNLGNSRLLTKALVGLEQVKWDPSGRALEVATRWRIRRGTASMGIEEVIIPATHLRNWMGTQQFRSTRFHAEKKEGIWHFKGFGNGHGVGMCQWGAKVMGEKQFKMAQILKHYYPDAILQKKW